MEPGNNVGSVLMHAQLIVIVYISQKEDRFSILPSNNLANKKPHQLSQ